MEHPAGVGFEGKRLMPRKLNRRKEIQLARRLQEKADEKRRHKKWPGTRRIPAHLEDMMVVSLMAGLAGMSGLFKRKSS